MCQNVKRKIDDLNNPLCLVHQIYQKFLMGSGGLRKQFKCQDVKICQKRCQLHAIYVKTI